HTHTHTLLFYCRSAPPWEERKQQRGREREREKEREREADQVHTSFREGEREREREAAFYFQHICLWSYRVYLAHCNLTVSCTAIKYLVCWQYLFFEHYNN